MLKLAPDFPIAQSQYLINQSTRATGIGPIALPGKVERTDYDSCGIRLEPERMEFGLNHVPCQVAAKDLASGDPIRNCPACLLVPKASRTD